MECLRKTLQRNVVKVLEQGGVIEIKVQMIENRSDKENIARELIKKLTGCVDEGDGSNLSGEQKGIVDDLLAEFGKNDIHFVGTCTNTPDSYSVSLGENDDSIGLLKTSCESGSLKDTLEKLFRALLDIPDSWPPLVKEVTTGKHSKKHHLNIETEQNTGI